MDFDIIGMIIQFIGTMMIAYTALSVHIRVSEDKGITENAVLRIKTERIFGYLGILLLTIGFIIQLYLKIRN